jgi:uncharacterized protein YecA (UPF0149 family)
VTVDTRNGRIYTEEEFKKLAEHTTKHLLEMRLSPTRRQLNRRPPKVGRNEPCPCGSGKKFKKCHLNKTEP